MSQSPWLCWRHVEEAKQIATKYSTDPKAPMNLGKIGCIGIGVADFCAASLGLDSCINLQQIRKYDPCNKNT